ncbi:hypothetical protein Ancab_003464 [Ancistrocladus abbreviatus]
MGDIRLTDSIAKQRDRDDLKHFRLNPFSRLETMAGMPAGILHEGDDDSSEKKLGWLRCQIIGGDEEFNSPFGKRRITYADTTASGRYLHYIENHHH